MITALKLNMVHSCQFMAIFVGPWMPLMWGFYDVGLHDSSVFISQFLISQCTITKPTGKSKYSKITEFIAHKPAAKEIRTIQISDSKD